MGACIGKDDKQTRQELAPEKFRLPADLRMLLVKQGLTEHELAALTSDQLSTKHRMLSVWKDRQTQDIREEQFRRQLEQQYNQQSQDGGGLTPRSKADSETLRAKGKLSENVMDVFKAADEMDSGSLKYKQLQVLTDAFQLAVSSESTEIVHWESSWRLWATALKKNLTQLEFDMTPGVVDLKLSMLTAQASTSGVPVSMEEVLDAVMSGSGGGGPEKENPQPWRQ